jgi:hypothetical protein
MTIAPAYNKTMPDRVINYITIDQYRAAPHAIDTQALIRNGNQADQDAELLRIIGQASSWCDKCAEQPLTAQATNESMRARIHPQGILRLHPRQHPIVAVTGVSFGVDAASMSSLNDLSRVWVENQSVEIPLQASLGGGFTGPLQFGTAQPGGRVVVSLSYVAGYPVTTLASPSAPTDTTIVVNDPTGIVPGTHLRLAQGGGPSGAGSGQTDLSGASVTALSVAGNTVTLTGTVGVAFSAQAAVTGMPDEVEQACIYATTALLKQAGNGALVMKSGSAGTVSKDSGNEPGAEEFDIAESILALYRPVAP